jgi:hypothetical protein
MYRALRFLESAQNGAATLIGPLRKSERPAWLRTHHPPHSTRPGTWNWSKFCWSRTALWTTARRDFSRARVVHNSCKTGRKRGWWQSSDATELLTKKRQNGCQNVFFDVMSEVQKDLEDVSAGIGKIKNNLINKNFVRNLTSKLVRSTLTSPGWIRVNVNYLGSSR